MKAEYLQQCQTFKEGKHTVSGMVMSEKLDGQRCFWDGGISRGKRATDITYANVNKDHIATGLWSRYGKVVFAPNWWLDRLPKLALDGELYTKRGDRQNCRSIVSRYVPDDRWNQVVFKVFTSPPLATFMSRRRIKQLHFDKEIYGTVPKDFFTYDPSDRFIEIYGDLCSKDLGSAELCEQFEAKDIHKYLDTVIELGGEGIVLQAKYALWRPERSHNCLKLKPFDDAEGQIVGWSLGVGKYLGMMGSLVISWNNVRFHISGFTDAERKLNQSGPAHFKIGSIITFKYRGLTTDGVPVDARYWRKYD